MTEEKNNKFVCFVCRQTFTKKLSDKEALEQLEEQFGDWDVNDCELVCEDCFNKIIKSK